MGSSSFLPASATQWRQELRDRFDLEPFQADAAWLRASTAERPADVNPWSLPGIYIASIDFAKRAEVLRALEDVTWDLLVLDEAHLASALERSPRRGACRRLAVEADCPLDRHAGCWRSSRIRRRSADIGALDDTEPPVVFFRRTRAEVQGGIGRRSVLLRVQPTPAERRMHDLLERYTRRVWLESSARGDRTREARGDRASEARPLERRLPRRLGAAPADASE